jgi:hypothetical protein
MKRLLLRVLFPHTLSNVVWEREGRPAWESLSTTSQKSVETWYLGMSCAS